MKPKIQLSPRVVLILIVGMICLSCNKHEAGSIEEQFKGTLELHLDLSVTANKTNATGSQLKSGTIHDFQVQIFKKDEESPVLTFDHSSDIPELITLTQGEYYATASSGENPDAAFESPYYSGESDLFTIANGQTVTASVTCTLANVMVTVAYSDQVIASFDDYQTTVSNTAGSLLFVKDESRAGFFNEGPLDVETQLNYTAGGEPQTKMLLWHIEVLTGKHYEIRVNTTPDEGEFTIPITVDENVETIIVDLTDDTTGPPSESGSGELLITEIMYNPDALNDNEGEWIEVFNNSEEMINLKDLVIRKGGAGNFYPITTDLELNAGAYAVLARTISATDNVGYVYGSLSLNNSGDEIIISTYGTDGTDGSVICAVDYSAEGFNKSLDGKSLQLDPSVRDVSAARLGSNWCPATVSYSTGDLGTPGLENPVCE